MYLVYKSTLGKFLYFIFFYRADGHKLVGKKTHFSDLLRSEYSSGFTPKSKKNKKPKNEDKET